MKKILLSITVILLLTGCEKFLNVNPNNNAFESDLFKERAGFESGLAGIYTEMNHQSLYSKEMKFGFMESMVGYYTNVNSAHYYYRSSRHEFSFSQPLNSISDIWGRMYHIINQGNSMLKYVDNLPKDNDYKLIKGEILGLRAFLHLQLLKMFGPVISEEGLEAQGIPYRKHIEFSATKFSTAGEVIEAIKSDLQEAKELLKDDPIRTVARNANQNQYAYEKYNSLIDNRGIRMNYYTIVALQALSAQWANDLPLARSFADELILELEGRTNSIHLATPAELVLTVNKRMPMESLFSLMDQNLLTNSFSVNAPVEDTRPANSSPLLFVNYNFLLNTLYNLSGEGSLNDFRLMNWFTSSANSPSLWKLTKFHFNQNYLFSNIEYKTYFENKIIGLHQISLIAAEEYADSNPEKAIAYLNKVRNSRNLTNNIVLDANKTSTVIKNMIFNEIRKENIGEGMLISEYKRLFRQIDRPQVVRPKVEIFKFPVPSDEQMYNPQN